MLSVMKDIYKCPMHQRYWWRAVECVECESRTSYTFCGPTQQRKSRTYDDWNELTIDITSILILLLNLNVTERVLEKYMVWSNVNRDEAFVYVNRNFCYILRQMCKNRIWYDRRECVCYCVWSEYILSFRVGWVRWNLLFWRFHLIWIRVEIKCYTSEI